MMSDNTYATLPTLGLLSGGFLSAVLAFGMLAAGTAAVTGELFAKAPPRTGQARLGTAVVTLPEVVVTGRRPTPTRVAVDAKPQRTL